MDWEEIAACRGMDGSLFYDPDKEADGLAICGICPVRIECLGEARRLSEVPGRFGVYGIWGGSN